MFSSRFLLLSLLPILACSAPIRFDHNAQNDHHHVKRIEYVTETDVVTVVETATVTPTPIQGGHVLSPTKITSSILPQSTQTHNSTINPLVMAYYPDWSGDAFPPEKINFTRFDWIDFAFAIPDGNFGLTWDDPQGAPSLLKRLVNAAHGNDTKVKLSIGGWDGSQHFSAAVATSDSRSTFAKNILSVYNKYNLDGIDIDWEYPGQAGEGKHYTSSDTSNFLLFLQHLRDLLPSDAKITAATQTVPFAGSNGDPIKDASQFAKVLDWVLLMNYDVWGSSPDPGPNAPLSNECKNSTQPTANAAAGYKEWTKAGFPASQIVLGVPSYAYISKSLSTNLRQRSESRFDARATNSKGYVQVLDTDGSGQIQFNDLVKQGALVRSKTQSQTKSGNAVYVGGGGFTRYWDKCSSTPFLRSGEVGQVITYDDPESLGMKAEFVKTTGMLGVNMFDVHGDTDAWDLTDSIRNGLGL